MTTPKPHPKPKRLSRDKATLHAQIRALEKERDALRAAVKSLMNAIDYWIENPDMGDPQQAMMQATKALANAGEKT